MADPEQLKAMVEKLEEDEALYVLYLFRGRFAWYVEMFDFEDGKQWWDEEENGPLTHEAWREVVEACNKFTDRAAGDAVYYAVDAVASRWADRRMRTTAN